MAKEPQAKKWYRLDNAGILYSALQTEQYSAIYRFTAVMARPVEPQALRRAIQRTMPRFPGFSVCIRRGLFWYYLEPNRRSSPFLKEDVRCPCRPVRFQEDNGWLVRFYYYENRLSLEVFHALSDGAGTMVFFKTLLAVYLQELGVEMPWGDGILNVEEPPRPEELEDAYLRYAGERALPLRFPPRAYPNTGTPEPFYTLHVVVGTMAVEQVKARARAYGATVTEYLTAVLLQVIAQRQDRENPLHKRPVSLVVPVNLRSFFPSETLRNFIITVSPGIDPSLGEYTFPEIVAQVRSYLKLWADPHKLRALITRNVGFTTNRFLQRVPVVLKNPILALNYRLGGTRPYSGTISNPGQVRLPPQMAPHIDHVEVILGQATVPRSHCCVVSCNGTMAVSFAGTLKETDTPRDFFRFLVKEGIRVKVTANDPGY